MAVRPSTIQARPTLYKGIQMRSRLEADFAQALDKSQYKGRWRYEPLCFASDQGQYLPDFEVRLSGGRVGYAEIKPLSMFPADQPYVKRIDEILERMTIIWAPGNEPDARLSLVGWEYGATIRSALTVETMDDGIWWVSPAGNDGYYLWPGMGQLTYLSRVPKTIERASEREIGLALDLEQIRRVYPSAYKRWSREEEQLLLTELDTGCSVTAIAKGHGRQEGAIRARLMKLGRWQTPDGKWQTSDVEEDWLHGLDEPF